MKRLIRIIRLLFRISRKNKKRQKDYLKGKFERELNYQLWVTKGSRFTAAKRLETQSSQSIWALSLFSAYLIIMSVMQITIPLDKLSINESHFTFISISLSILILTIGQIVNKSELKTRAKMFHKCALEIGEIYNELRIAKNKGADGSADINKVEELNQRYQAILKGYENHKSIDYNKFRSTKPKYPGHDIGWFEVKKYQASYLVETYFLSLTLMVAPAVFIVWVIYNTLNIQS